MVKFGTVAREGHDSSEFYAKKLYEGLRTGEKIDPKIYKEYVLSKDIVNKVYSADSRDMYFIADESVHLMVTSPPYNVGKEYDEDLTLEEYRQLLYDVLSETYRVLVQGGRMCINIANVGRSPYIPLHLLVTNIALDIGYLMRGEVIWDKGASAGGSCAWGSWKSASNPVLRDVHEYILIFSKDSYKRVVTGDNTISRDEFLENTKSIWKFRTASAKAIGYPAPFPEELPKRCIQLYSFEGDTVLDPFIGSGTTAVVAKKLGRNYLGFDIDRDYVELAENRIAKVKV